MLIGVPFPSAIAQSTSHVQIRGSDKEALVAEAATDALTWVAVARSRRCRKVPDGPIKGGD
jgi:hypothetical protein